VASTASNSTPKSQSFLFSVIHSDPVSDSTADSRITVIVALANRSVHCWMLDTGATNHVTGNRHLFETFHPISLGEHQVKTANNSFGDAEVSGTITFWVNWPNANPVKIVLQYILCVPACGTNILLRFIQLMRKGINFDFKFNGAMASLASVLVYEVLLINSLFVLRASAISASVSKASVVLDDPLRSAPSSAPQISEAYSFSWHLVDDKDILVWHWPSILAIYQTAPEYSQWYPIACCLFCFNHTVFTLLGV